MCTFMKIFRSVLLRMRNVSEIKLQKKSIHTLYIQSFFSENPTIYEIMLKGCGTARQATDDNMEHAHCMLGT